MRKFTSILLLLIFAALATAQTYNTGNTSNLSLQTKYGGAYFYTSALGVPTAVTVEAANQYAAVPLVTTATNLNGWTHKVGTGPVAVASVANNNAVVANTILVTTSVDHNLAVGDYVKHTGFAVRTVYSGTWKVLAVPLSTTYTVGRAYDTSTDTGFAGRSFSLRANTGSAGTYLVQFSSSIQSDANTTDFRMELVKNTTDLDNITSQVLFSTQNRPGAMGGVGLVTVADDDVIWLHVKNLTDTTDLKVWLFNFVVTRL